MSAWSVAVAALSPYAWWRMGEASGTTMVDASGNSRNGTYTASGVTYNVTGLVPGGDGTAITLGTSPTATTPTISVSSVAVTHVVTMKSSGTKDNILVATTGTYRLELSGTTATMRLDVSNSVVFTGYNSANLFDGAAHLIVVKVTSTTAELWVDGTMVGSGSHSAPGTTLTAMRIKSTLANPVATFDEWAIFNSALTTGQIGDLYTAWTGTVADANVELAGTLQAKTAAFTMATVLAVSLAGTMQPKTASFELEAIGAPDRTVELAGELQRKTASFTVLTASDVTLAATLQPKTASFSLLGGASMSLAATLQAKTAAFELETSKTLTLAATMRRKTAAFTIVSNPAIRLAATLRAKTAAFSITTTPTMTLATTLQPKVASFITYAVTPVVPTPSLIAGHSVVVAQAFGAVTMSGTQPQYTISEASTPRARQQILIDGEDWTYFRGGITPDVTYTLLAPLLYGPGELNLPMVSAVFETLGVGELAPLRAGAPVEVNLVVDDVVVKRGVYKAVIVAFDKSGRNLSVELGGEASGRAALRDRQMVIFPRVNDLGHQIADAVRDLGLPHYPPLGTVTGIETMTTGGVGHLEHIQDRVSIAWTRAGKHWTVMPDEGTGAYETHQKDETTVHATAFVDDARTVATLRRDISEEPNRIFITGVTPQGLRVRFGVYPGLKQGDPPPFPGHLENGDTGEGVRLLIGRLQGVGYLKLEDVSGGYDFDVISAVEALQFDAKLPQTGEVNEATWNALYDLDITTPSLVGAHIEPAAQLDVVREKIRSGSGIVIGYNDDYDPEVLVSDRTIDAGVGKTRGQLREFALAVLEASSAPNWVGDIKFNTGALIRGEVAIGYTMTEADVMDARELRPGMNVWLPQFEGGILVHVSACQIDEDGIATATVDTRFRDAMEVWDIIDRNKESRNDPARRRNQKHRSSTIRKDSIGEIDEFGGRLWQDVHLDAGWNVFEVILAMEGTVSRFLIELGTVAEFAVAVFGRPVDRGFMDDVIGPPLTEDGTRNWRRATPRARLKDRWVLYSEGTDEEPCGYGSDLKSDGAELTGTHETESEFAYRTEDRTRAYVAVWVEEENTIPLGRIMWPQLEAGA